MPSDYTMRRIFLEYVTIANIFYFCFVVRITYNLPVSQGSVFPSAEPPPGYNALWTRY